MPMRAMALGLATCVSLGLAACDRGAGSGATGKPNAPDSPGTGNAPVVAVPASGSGGSDSSGRAQPGAGLQGGLGTGQSGAPAEGSTNRTTKGSVGNR